LIYSPPKQGKLIYKVKGLSHDIEFSLKDFENTDNGESNTLSWFCVWDSSDFIEGDPTLSDQTSCSWDVASATSLYSCSFKISFSNLKKFYTKIFV